MAETSCHVSVDIAEATCTASHRDANFVRNIICFVAVEYLADVCDRDHFSDGASQRTCVSERCPSEADLDTEWEEDQPQKDQQHRSVDDDIWHVGRAGLDFDNPDADFGSTCDEQSAHAGMEPPRKEQRGFEQLVPTFM